MAPDDRWLQFGISPVDAYLRRAAPEFELSPCPIDAYWTGGGQSDLAVLITISPIAATLQNDAPIASSLPSEQVSVGMGLPPATLTKVESAPLRSTTLSWPLDGSTFSYRVVGDEPDISAMRQTACRTLRPAVIGFLCGLV